MRDVAEDFSRGAWPQSIKVLQRDVDKERLSGEEKQAIVGRIKTTTELSSLSDAFIVVEAVTEDPASKNGSVSHARSNHET
jgi:3-hydroxybutyryl-CoA dehydrogenase